MIQETLKTLSLPKYIVFEFVTEFALLQYAHRATMHETYQHFDSKKEQNTVNVTVNIVSKLK